MNAGYKRGQTSVVLRVKLFDSSVSTGAGKTGLSSSSSGLIIATAADNEASATAYTQAGSTIESITTLGTYAAPTATKCRFKEFDATNHPGVYEIQFADARFAVSSAKSLFVSISGVTNLAQMDLEIPLLDFDPYDVVRGGFTALPNAAAEASGGLYTRGTGAGQIRQDANGRIDTNVKAYGDSAGTFASGRAEVNITHCNGSAITSASGRPEVNLTHIAAAAVSTSTAQLGVNVVNFGGSAGTFSAGLPSVNVSKVNGVTVTGTGASGDEWGP
jgi:hypothetical protein